MARNKGSVLGNNRHEIATLLTIIFTRQKKKNKIWPYPLTEGDHTGPIDFFCLFVFILGKHILLTVKMHLW